MRAKLEELFGVDLRSLAVFRIALACVLLFDLLERAPDFVAHYTDLGILPAPLLPLLTRAGARFSLHAYVSGSVAATAGLLLLAGLAAAALLLGYRTRLATLVSWYLLASLQMRNPWISTMGGDHLLRILLFWGLFLPLGARFSVDAARDARLRDAGERLVSIPTAALLLQVALVYWVTGIKKDGATWLDGSAVHLALHLDYFVTGTGVWLRELDGILPLFTHATRWFEILGPFLAFSPVATAPLRMFAIAAFAVFHICLGVALYIGLFPLVSLAAWCAFLPSAFWDAWLPRLRSRPPSPADAGRAPLPTPPWAQIAAAVLFVYVAVFLGGQLAGRHDVVPLSADRLARALRMNQYWSMFSPNPNRVELWPIAAGRTADGESVDPLRSAPLSWDAGDRVPTRFWSFRWRLWFTKFLRLPPPDPGYRPLHESLAALLCRDWNARHVGNERLEALRTGVLSVSTLEPQDARRAEHLAFRCGAGETGR